MSTRMQSHDGCPALCVGLCEWVCFNACVHISLSSALFLGHVVSLHRPRWYDARARIALKRLCEWLNVPWSRVQNFEMLLAYQVEKGEKTRPTVSVDNWTKSKRLATIAAIAVAGGGAFALVGRLFYTLLAVYSVHALSPMHLNAPTGAVVMMPLFAFALPGVAFFTSAGGMAAVTSTMAALGLADAGSRATRRTQRTRVQQC